MFSIYIYNNNIIYMYIFKLKKLLDVFTNEKATSIIINIHFFLVPGIAISLTGNLQHTNIVHFFRTY